MWIVAAASRLVRSLCLSQRVVCGQFVDVAASGEVQRAEDGSSVPWVVVLAVVLQCPVVVAAPAVGDEPDA